MQTIHSDDLHGSVNKFGSLSKYQKKLNPCEYIISVFQFHMFIPTPLPLRSSSNFHGKQRVGHTPTILQTDPKKVQHRPSNNKFVNLKRLPLGLWNQ
jgi:hypothetical protein